MSYFSGLAYKLPDNISPQELQAGLKETSTDWLKTIGILIQHIEGTAPLSDESAKAYYQTMLSLQDKYEALAGAVGPSAVQAYRLYVNMIGGKYPDLNLGYRSQAIMDAIKAMDPNYDFNPMEYKPKSAEPDPILPGPGETATGCEGKASDCPQGAIDWYYPGEWSKLKYDLKIDQARIEEIGQMLKMGMRSAVPELQPGFVPGSTTNILAAGMPTPLKLLVLGLGLSLIVGLAKAK